MSNLTSVIVLAASNELGDPGDLLPSGPNFNIFSGMSGVTQLVIGAFLAIVIVIGVAILIGGIGKFRVGDKDTGRGAKGLAQIISGAIIIALGLVIIPIILLIISTANSVGNQIN